MCCLLPFSGVSVSSGMNRLHQLVCILLVAFGDNEVTRSWKQSLSSFFFEEEEVAKMSSPCTHSVVPRSSLKSPEESRKLLPTRRWKFDNRGVFSARLLSFPRESSGASKLWSLNQQVVSS